MARTRRAFDFTPPSYEEAQKIVESSASIFDSIIKSGGPKTFKAVEGLNIIRILPPTWENAHHYGLKLKIHRNIGINSKGRGDTYICPKEQEGSPYKECPICTEIAEMYRKRVSNKEIDPIKLQESIVYYVLDQQRGDRVLVDEPLVWITSMKNNGEIVAQSLVTRSHTHLNITHPINGYDVEFTRKGTGQFDTKYLGFKVVRDSTPLSFDENEFDRILDYIEEHPIPDILQIYSPEHIYEKFHGRLAEEDRQGWKPPEDPRRETRSAPARKAHNGPDDTQGRTAWEDEPRHEAAERGYREREPERIIEREREPEHRPAEAGPPADDMPMPRRRPLSEEDRVQDRNDRPRERTAQREPAGASPAPNGSAGGSTNNEDLKKRLQARIAARTQS